jgi:hypothetical protein
MFWIRLSTLTLTAAAFLAMALPSQAGDKYGFPAQSFATMTYTQQSAYAAGVMDTLDIMGIRCPASADVTYKGVMDATQTFIALHPEIGTTEWTAGILIRVLADKGCRRE